MTAPQARSRRSHRGAMLAIGTLVAAGCLAGSAALAWWSRSYTDALTGAVETSVSGSAIVGALIPVAVLAVAGLGAIAATRGWLRRAVGVLLAAAGILAAVRSVLLASDAPTDLLRRQLIRPARAVSEAHLAIAGPSLAVLGGALLAAAGIAVAVARQATRGGLGSAYDSPAARRARRDRTDPGDLWQALDAGVDPTIAPGREGDVTADTMDEPQGSIKCHDEETTR